MGITGGSIKFRRYQVVGEPASSPEQYEQAIRDLAFRGFTPGDGKDKVLGFIATRTGLADDLHSGEWLVDRYIVLSVRIDTKKIPASYLRQECAKLVAERCRQSGRAKITRQEKDEIKETVTKALLERVIPSSKSIDIVWDMERNEVLFWSTSTKDLEIFEEVFPKTFGVRVHPLFPYALALKLMPDAVEQLEAIESVSFTSEQPGSDT